MKKFFLLIAIILLGSGLAGCNQNTIKSEDSIEITVITPFGSEDGNHVNYVTAYQAYEAESGNTVKDLSGTSNEEWKTQVLSYFDTGLEPDVLFFFTGADANELIKNGKVVPITDIRNYNPTYAVNMKDSLMPVSPLDGRQYAVPVNGYWEGLFVNEKVLATCGIEIPDGTYTWEQFLNDCKIIRDNGYVPIACSLNEVPHYWFEFTTFNNGNIFNHVLLPESSDDEIGEIWVAGLNDIKELYESGFFPADTNSITDSQANLLMTNDKAAFMIDGSWKIGWFEANAADLDDFTVTYVPGKGERKSTDIIGGLSMGYYITKKAWDNPQKRDACVNFVISMTTDEVVSSFGALSITALKNGTTPPQNASSFVHSALIMTKGCTGITAAAQDGLSLPARNALFADIKNIVNGIVTPEQAIDNCLAK